MEYAPTANIGDAFYQGALLNLLRNLRPFDEVSTLDGPPGRSFRHDGRFRENIFDIRIHYAADIWCFSGPILNDRFMERYAPLIVELRSAGKQYMMLSCAGPHNCESRRDIKAFLRQYPPIAFSTRSEITYEQYRDISDDSYNGVCAAFFSSFLFTPPIERKKWIVSSFYSGLEPDISFTTFLDGSIDIDSVQIKEKKYPLWRIIRHIEWLRPFPEDVAGYKIIRPVHDLSYKFGHMNFGKPNSYLSPDPFSYLSIYAASDLTISDRIHACVASLSFGNPAIVCGKWDRIDLMSRMGIGKKGLYLLPPSREQIKKEYQNFSSWLSNRLENALL
ncbi:MAG: polysaccharide pyruvyl transferase family protein [Chloroflexi bacterium]|nr:polysaccharide pyruvyl transferase family protein [Chloroflexota bacterium]